MKNNTLILSIVAFFAISIATLGIAGIYLLGTYNSAAGLRNTYEMKIKDNESEYDNMWKKISQTAQIADAQKEGFRQVYSDYAQARTPQSQNQLMTWIKESAPNIDLSIYKQVLNTITGSRDSWTMRQKELVGIAEEYNKKMVTMPSGFILKLFGFQIIDPKVITSGKTEAAFATGKDDDVDLNLNKK